MDLAFFDAVKKLTIIALVSDDELMDALVLKGGNALDLIYNLSSRASVDLDFSLATEFDRESLNTLRDKIEKLLLTNFVTINYKVFDVTLNERPNRRRLEQGEDDLSFWGGYKIEFKLIENAKYDQFTGDIVSMRKWAAMLANNSTKFSVDISKYEFCENKVPISMEGYTVYVYSPIMIVCEKLRAICQQMKEYGVIVHSRSQSERARDFFDIHILIETLKLDLIDENSMNTLREIFAIKKVPLHLLGLIPEYKEYHKEGFPSLQSTVKAGIELRDFDFYFDYVVEKVSLLKPFWDI